MSQNTKISVMPHTHWDREWYFPSSKSLIYSLYNFKEVMDYLKKDKNFKYFLLDGQVSIIDDYIKYNPEDEELIRSLISEGRLLVGPWYTQTDLLVISGESIIRNIFYGMNRAKKLGKCMMVGYVPDCFGQSAQMPQIYNGFNINKTAFRRGLSETQIKKTEFYWEGPGGSKVFAHNIIDYGNMINPPRNTENIKTYFDEKIKELGELSTSNHIVLMNGQDQRPIRKDLLEIINKAKEDVGFDIEINSIENILDTLEKEAIDIECYKGELTFGQKSRVHKSIFSTRADLKILNNKAENLITNILEPVCTIAYSLGQKYNTKVIEEIWKLMFENAAHDSIGMCNSDTVNDDIKARYKRINNLALDLLEINQRLIGQSIEEKDIFQFQVYNLLPYKRSQVVKARLFTPSENFKIVDSNGKEQKHHVISSKNVTEKIRKDSLHEIGVNGDYVPRWSKDDIEIFDTEMYIMANEIEGMGYKTLYFESISEKVEETDITREYIIENQFTQVEVSEDGNVTIRNKIEKKELTGVFIIEDSGDDGDSYDYSEPREDRYYYSKDSKISNIKVSRNSLVQEITYDICMDIPQNLVQRANNIQDQQIDIRVKIMLTKTSETVDFNVTIDNKAIEHRMRALFKTDISSTTSIADQQFGSIKRKTYLPEIEIWEKDNWVEKPRTIEPMQSFVTLKNAEYGLAVFTDCVREYQIVGESLDTIALTLFRSTPYMGKEELLDRPGRASGMEWETPDASLLRKLTFNFSLRLYEDLNENQLAKHAREIFTPFSIYQASNFKNNFEYFILNKSEERNTPQEYSLLEFKNENLVLSTFKKCEKNEGYILRFFNGNINGNKTDEILLKDIKIKDAKEVMLDEESVIKELEFTESIKINAKPSQFKTIYME
ncbi:glycoside hydrolase family 38 C-terminal domain-containing protein [Clostridium sp. ZS2-4]|uniref:glycoside hydrolase family 38 N-terminal domain-containing protein n=1 Tax=Clostridium sp. ZS2-4 TaxID=2987703 RepID=UPI00227C95AF|nr:glycoside hydrolase family 38 C-terminal domain-containing protein [Clostridium sp. ZS2-4]MCY6354438.1 alpha-mannosidase [Clostridium sp. ZS2-4]